MKTKLAWGVALLLLGAGADIHAADILLKDGRVLKDAKVVGQSPTAVMIRYPGGLSSVAKTLLPPELARQYPVDEVAAAEARAAEAARVTPRLQLGNGRILTNAWITSESTTQVWIRHAEGGGEFAKELLPEPLRERYPVDHRAEAQARLTAARQEQERQRIATAQSGDERAEREREAKRLKEVAAKARNHAENYFRFLHRPGSGAIWVSNLKLDLEPPTRVGATSPLRFEVEGQCFMEYYDSAGRSFAHQVSQAFVVTVEARGDTVNVADLSFHYAPRR